MKNPYIEKQRKIKKLVDVWETLQAQRKSSFNYSLLDYNDKIVIKFFDIDDLKQARQLAKNVYPNWKDKLKQIWTVGNKIAMVSWEDIRFDLIEIWLKTFVEKFPDELLPKDKDCKFEKIIIEETILTCNKTDE